ncbi:hypothetical protein DOMOVOI_01900 [Brevundimonas phage vB_BpoS-Domovoi]|uniref:Uncharacterized protein n=1 Tax=Brevundimonas phage vB_BpoS-Domovoi TaxID=2948598 RepID=A0A9E7SKM2_9CAUD|nr:hypothetical protein DOMOVOI_01900 [Brevundimonas phage vB_BpoS-Domovoi]
MTYPRYSNGHVDTGVPLLATSRQKRCPKCNSTDYVETVSREKCRSCGLECDYWGTGANAIYQEHLEAKWAREEQEREAALQREIAEEERQRYLSSLPGDDGDGW